MNVEIGDWVTAGQMLAVIDSRDVGDLKTELIAALAQEELSRTTVDRLASPRRAGNLGKASAGRGE